MVVTYTTAAKVATLLQITLTSSTKPTTTEVEGWINSAEDHIDRETGHSWRTVTITNEYHNLDMAYVHGTGIPVYLKHRTITTLASSTDLLELWDGNSWVDWLASSEFTEGRENDYWMDEEMGILWIRTRFRFTRKVVIRLKYRYGESTIPDDIQTATAKLAALNVIASDHRSNILPETGTGSQLAYKDIYDQYKEAADRVISNHREIGTISN